jgi:DNA-binding transcriptional MerR regulator
MAKYSIKDLERLSGIKAHTIRMWEKRYSIITPERSDTNIRKYQDSELKRLLNIAILNNNGYKISHIACFCSETIRMKVLEVCQSGCSQQAEIDRLVVCTVDLDEEKFEKILSANILRLGFESTFHNVVHPFLLKVGVLWQTGSMNFAQERFASNLIRRKLHAAIDGLIGESIVETKTFTLFQPQGEAHELLLLYYQYLIRRQGHRVVYLGTSVPVEEAATAVHAINSDYVLVGFSCYGCGPSEDLVNQLSAVFPSSRVMVTIPKMIERSQQTPENVINVKCPIGFQKLLVQV